MLKIFRVKSFLLTLLVGVAIGIGLSVMGYGAWRYFTGGLIPSVHTGPVTFVPDTDVEGVPNADKFVRVATVKFDSLTNRVSAEDIGYLPVGVWGSVGRTFNIPWSTQTIDYTLRASVPVGYPGVREVLRMVEGVRITQDSIILVCTYLPPRVGESVEIDTFYSVSSQFDWFARQKIDRLFPKLYSGSKNEVLSKTERSITNPLDSVHVVTRESLGDELADWAFHQARIWETKHNLPQNGRVVSVQFKDSKIQYKKDSAQIE